MERIVHNERRDTSHNERKRCDDETLVHYNKYIYIFEKIILS
jgi:hypothetical protein